MTFNFLIFPFGEIVFTDTLDSLGKYLHITNARVQPASVAY